MRIYVNYDDAHYSVQTIDEVRPEHARAVALLNAVDPIRLNKYMMLAEIQGVGMVRYYGVVVECINYYV